MHHYEGSTLGNKGRRGVRMGLSLFLADSIVTIEAEERWSADYIGA